MSINNGGKMRLKVLLIILGIVIIAFGIVFYFYSPYSEAARGGVKGKPQRTPTPTQSPGATPTSSPTTSPSPATSPTTSPSPTTTLFSDDFSGSLSKWQIVYTGYGTVGIENGELSMAPKASTQPLETHAPLIIAGDVNWGDYIYTLRMNSLTQLRTGSAPNPWEVGWIPFRMPDQSNFYYFILKTNGIELGKALSNNQQKFFVTKDTPKLTLNQWNDFKIVLKGANIKVYVNNTLVADYTDNDNPFLKGKIGLYNEDAHVHYDNVVVTAN